MVIGQEKGRAVKDKVMRNFGMPKPEGYRKALRLMELAERFKMPVITLIDTPGAYPGIDSEERGISESIAQNLAVMSRLATPIICIVIGEGSSGGALGIGVGDHLAMLQYSTYFVISPEGCANIIWKSTDNAPDAAEAMGVTSSILQDLGIVDATIPEPLGGAHRDVDLMASGYGAHRRPAGQPGAVAAGRPAGQALPAPDVLRQLAPGALRPAASGLTCRALLNHPTSIVAATCSCAALVCRLQWWRRFHGAAAPVAPLVAGHPGTPLTAHSCQSRHAGCGRRLAAHCERHVPLLRCALRVRRSRSATPGTARRRPGSALSRV